MPLFSRPSIDLVFSVLDVFEISLSARQVLGLILRVVRFDTESPVSLLYFYVAQASHGLA